MDEPQYVIYEECSPLAAQGNDVHKVAIASDSFQTTSSLASSAYVSSSHSSSSVLPRTTLPINHFIKEGVQTLSQAEILDSKLGCVSHISILPSNVLTNSVLSLQGETVLSEENRIKVENGNEMVITNSCYGAIDSGSAAYRLLLASLPCSSLIKNNLSDKCFDQNELTSNLPTSSDTNNESLAEEADQTKNEHWTSDSVNPLVLSTSPPSINLKGKKGSPHSQVVVKLLQDDLNFDMVEIISPNLDNSQIFEIIEKDNEISKSSLGKEVTSDISSANLKFITTSDNTKVIHQQTDDFRDINPNFNILYSCSSCNKFFSLESACNEHRKMCLTQSNNSDTGVKDSQLPNEIDSIFHTRNASSNDKKGKCVSKPNLVWICMICSQEYASILNLKIHYVSHSIEELATALLKCTLPTCSRNEKSNNVGQPTKTDAQNSSMNKIEDSIMGVISPTTESKQEINSVRNIKENELHSNPGDKTLNGPKIYTVKSAGDITSYLKNKPYTKSKKTKINSKGRVKSRVNGSELKSRDPHSCPVCKKVLSSRGNLVKHLIQHEAVKPWVCKVCGSGFNSKRNHDYHYMQRHTTLRPSVCNICGKGYTNKRTLTEHMIFHRKEKDFSCLLCGKGFRTKKCVNRHMQRHEKNRKFVCNLCFKAFRVNVDLVSHFKLVHSSDNKKTKCRTLNLKSHPTTAIRNHVSDQFPQNDSSDQNTINKTVQSNPRSVDDQQMTLIQEQMQSASNSDQFSKMKEFSELLHSHSSTILPDIGNEFHSTNLSETRDALMNGENIEAQTIIPVSSATEEHVYNNAYGLTLHNKHSIMNSDLSSPGAYVIIGLTESQTGAENSSDKNTWNTLGEYKAVYQDASSKEPNTSQNVAEISLLPTVLESISRTYPDGVEEDVAATAGNAVMTKPLRRSLSIGKAVSEKNLGNNVNGSKMNEGSKDDSLTSDTQTQTLNLDLLSQTLHLDFQSSHGNGATGFL